MQLIHLLIFLVSTQLLFQNCSAARFGTVGTDPNQSVSASGEIIGGSGGSTDAGTELACGNELIVNGDFESIDNRSGLVFNKKLNELNLVNGWDVYSTLPDAVGGASWYATDGTSGIEVQSGAVVSAASGKNSIELDSQGNSERGLKTNSGMYQIIFVNEAGSYILAFSYRGRSKNIDDNPIDVLIDGAKVKTVDASSSDGGWKTYRLKLSLEAKMHKIEFQAQGLESTYGGLLDLVSLRKACPKVGP